MPHVLKNNQLEIYIDFPQENYQKARFDWTGKIVKVAFKKKTISGSEFLEPNDGDFGGVGFCNEFGIESPIGFEEIEIGDWFHKIGVGLLQKNSDVYTFHKNYKIKPCEFEVEIKPNSVFIQCISQKTNGYSYVLEKEIKLLENGFLINYSFRNTGDKTIRTDEYNHNFIAIGNDCIGKDYQLKFPFFVKPELFEETVNPEGKAIIGDRDLNFSDSPKEAFFFSNLSGGESVDASWELFHEKTKIGIREIGDFQTNKINLWGCVHTVCPELFFDILVVSGEELNWSRKYELFELD